MDYHPLMGIALFAGTVLVAFLIGQRIAKRRRNMALHAGEPTEGARGELSEGDADAPDAPWLRTR